MYLALDYYVTESSGHNSEYNWWFRKRPDLIEKYATHGTNWNPGEHAYILKEYRRRESDWRDDIHAWFEQDEIDLERGHEYAAYIINAMEGGRPFKFNGNVPNKGLVDNLPNNACVEVPVWVSRDGLEAVAVGPLAAIGDAADQSLLADRGDGGGGHPQGRPAADLSGGGILATDGSGLLAAGDSVNGRRAVRG